MTSTVHLPEQQGPGTGAQERLAAAGSDAYAERLLHATLGAFEIISVCLGERLGYYRALAEHGAMTPVQLAARTGTAERYAREWLEQQAVSDLLLVEGAGEDRAYSLGPGAREVLADESSLTYLAPIGRLFPAVGAVFPALLEAYRTGGGVPWEQLGADAREAQAALNRPWFEQRLGPALRDLPEVDGVLSRPGARILDVGCGGAWSTVALARAYPHATAVGVDVDSATVEMAREQVAAAGLADRVEIRLADAAQLAGADGSFDAAFAFECVHDMSDPVGVLAAVRRAVRPDGAVVVMDEAVAEDFTAPGDDLERFMYGASILICLPDGLSRTPSAATGTVMRRSTLDRYATAAGFRGTQVLPVDDFSFFRFYRLLH